MTKSRAWEALIGEASRVVWCDQWVAVPATLNPPKFCAYAFGLDPGGVWAGV
jgi:hypothetical protein